MPPECCPPSSRNRVRHGPVHAAREQVPLGAVEGLNNRLKANLRKSYGFRTYRAIKVMLYHKLGALPELELTHRFC